MNVLPGWFDWVGDPVWVTAIATVILAVFTGVLAALTAPVLLAWRRESKNRKYEQTRKEFTQVRQYIKDNRCALAQQAFAVAKPPDYPKVLEGTSLVAMPSWILEKPVRIDKTQQQLAPLSQLSAPHESAKPFDWPGAAQMKSVLEIIRKQLPHDHQGNTFPSFSAAIREIEQPKLRMFSNRMSYKIRRTTPQPQGPPFEFVLGKYFENIDVGEALVYEFARAALRGSASMPARKFLGLPWDANVGLLPGIDTLTVVKSDAGPVVYMHDRRPGDVATAVASYHVAPAGEFQPSSTLESAVKRDFDLWLNTVREYAEEFLGREEQRDENALSIDYDNDSDFRPFMEAWRNQTARFYYLGFGLDPLSLKMEILTVCIFEEEAFKNIFQKRLEELAAADPEKKLRGPEGVILAQIAFEQKGGDRGWIKGKPLDEALKDFTDANSLPGAVACLRLFDKGWREGTIQ